LYCRERAAAIQAERRVWRAIVATHRTTHRTPVATSLSASPTIRNGSPASFGSRVCIARRLLIRTAGFVANNLAIFALTVVAFGTGPACVDSAMRTAPFRQRPDAAEPGSLKGPFTGRVIDATTHTPIAGALVYAAWTFERGAALSEPAGAKEFVGSTDAAGNYKVPTLSSVPGGARFTEFTLLVYKRGFIGYRSDRRFTDLGPRMDFAQTDNQILLERWRNELSHARHLRFVGAGTAVAAGYADSGSDRGWSSHPRTGATQSLARDLATDRPSRSGRPRAPGSRHARTHRE
jgi:hypothetical protein